VSERPILFSAPMVRALLAGRKTQTRRIVKSTTILGLATPEEWNARRADYRMQPMTAQSKHHLFWADGYVFGLKCPYGYPGDQLWVRETWADVNTCEGPAIAFRADGSYRSWHDFSQVFGPDYGAGPPMSYETYPGNYTMWVDDLLAGAEGHLWRPSIFMPRWASRITLEVTAVRVERLQDISEADCCAEGVGSPITRDCKRPKYERLWEEINGKGSWAANPWVWVISFRAIPSPMRNKHP
jgi:hypothetical protein